MRFTYTLRPDDLREYVRWGASTDKDHIRTRDTITMWCVIISISFAGLLANAQEDKSRAVSAAVVVLVPGILITINYWRKYAAAVAASAAKKFRTNPMPGLFESQLVSISDTEITISGTYVTSTFRWNAFTDLVELPKHIVLRQGSVQALLIPHDTIVGSEAPVVAELLRKNVQSAA